jgi:hypothetical protein
MELLKVKMSEGKIALWTLVFQMDDYGGKWAWIS